MLTLVKKAMDIGLTACYAGRINDALNGKMTIQQQVDVMKLLMAFGEDIQNEADRRRVVSPVENICKN